MQYHFRSLDGDDLLAHYPGCDIVFVTPLKHGMNFVAKEYCAGRIDGDGVLFEKATVGTSVTIEV